MAFDVRLRGVLVGEAQLAVGKIGAAEGRRELVVKSRAASAGATAMLTQISDETTTVIDVDTGLPLRLDSTAQVAGKVTTAHAEFAKTSAAVTFSHGPADDGTKPRLFRVDFGSATAFDMHSAMAQLRSWRPTKGAVRSVYVVGGRRLWRVDVAFLGVDSIGSAMGNRRAVHLDGQAYRVKPNLTLDGGATRTFSVWLTDDADRVPLRLIAKTELGDIAMDLTEYDRP